jgi:hypothetical protein
MDATTVAVAGLGLAATLAAAWLSARWQKRGLVETEILTAQVQAYGDCAQALYEFERVSYNRAVTMFRNPDADDASLAQEVYRHNSAARATIGRLAILSDDSSLGDRLEGVRKLIRRLHDLRGGEHSLKLVHRRIIRTLGEILGDVRNQFDDFQGR